MNIEIWTFAILSLFITDNDPNEVVSSQTKWKADSEGRKTKKVEYEEFNFKNDLLKRIEFTERRELCSKFRYEYTDDSTLVKSQRTGCQYEFDDGMETKFEYDDFGRLANSKEYERGKLVRRTTYKYEKDQRYPYLKQEFIELNSIPYSETELQYDSKGNLKEEMQKVSGSWFGSQRYQYDIEGNLVYMESEVDGGVGTVKYYYIYEDGELAKDSVLIPNAQTRYHVYENQKFE